MTHIELVLRTRFLDHFTEDSDLTITSFVVEVLDKVVVVVSRVELPGVQVLLLPFLVAARSLRTLWDVGLLRIQS